MGDTARLSDVVAGSENQTNMQGVILMQTPHARTSAFEFVTAIGLAIVAAIAAKPALAQLPPGMKPAELSKVADCVYSFRYFIHRNMIVITDEGVVVSDPLNPNAAKAMMAEIKKLTDKPVKYVIYSHNHWDHIAGAKIFRDAGAEIVAHELAAQNTKQKWLHSFGVFALSSSLLIPTHNRARSQADNPLIPPSETVEPLLY